MHGEVTPHRAPWRPCPRLASQIVGQMVCTIDRKCGGVTRIFAIELADKLAACRINGIALNVVETSGSTVIEEISTTED